MRLLISIICACVVTGCAVGPSPFKRLVSPAQDDYDSAEKYFQNKEYDSAIAVYEKFIKEYPRSNLIPGAHLGIAWSKYLLGDYKGCIDALAQVRVTNKGLISWIQKLQTDAKDRLAKSEGSASTPSLFNIPAFTNQDTLSIEGTVPDGSKISVNGKEGTIQNGLFKQELTLQEGENHLAIIITDKDGKSETKEAVVTLDKAPVLIKVNSAELDDFGFVELKGTTKAGAQVTAEDTPLTVDAQGNFEGRVRMTRTQEINLKAEDRAGNVAKKTFSDTSYPDKPTGLRIRSASGLNVDIEWDANREKNLKGYNVYTTDSRDSSSKKNNREIITDTIYTMDNLQPGTTYTIVIRAVTKMGNESDPSLSVTAVIP